MKRRQHPRHGLAVMDKLATMQTLMAATNSSSCEAALSAVFAAESAAGPSKDSSQSLSPPTPASTHGRYPGATDTTSALPISDGSPNGGQLSGSTRLICIFPTSAGVSPSGSTSLSPLRAALPCHDYGVQLLSHTMLRPISPR